jgi:hypothetical protein
MEKEKCKYCNKESWQDRAGYAFVVRECRKCEEPVCENCAELDYDCDEDGFFNTQWDCPDCVGRKKNGKTN